LRSIYGLFPASLQVPRQEANANMVLCFPLWLKTFQAPISFRRDGHNTFHMRPGYFTCISWWTSILCQHGQLKRSNLAPESYSSLRVGRNIPRRPGFWVLVGAIANSHVSSPNFLFPVCLRKETDQLFRQYTNNMDPAKDASSC